MRWHNFTNASYSFREKHCLATQRFKAAFRKTRPISICLTDSLCLPSRCFFFFLNTPLPPPILFWFCREDTLVSSEESTPLLLPPLLKEASHAFDQNMECMHNQGGPCMATAVVALATSPSLRKGHVWSFGAKVLTGAVKTHKASWRVDTAIMSVQTQNSVIHLLVYHPNKWLGLCALGHGGLFHHYVEWLVVFLVVAHK